MTALSRPRVLGLLGRTLRPFLAAQDLRPRSRTRGAFIRPEWGLDDPSHTGTTLLLAGCVWTALWGPRRERDGFIRRAELAAASLLRAQHPGGLIDLKGCNFESAPDTAFAVQLVCAVLECAGGEPSVARCCEPLKRFILRAAPGIAQGGFHTPNHRWVIASALAWTHALLPETDQRRTMQTYLAEGIDQDTDGAYQERSPAVYDGVTNRSLWLLHRHAGWAPALPAIRRNLALDTDLLHADGTIDSTLSRRQDRDWRQIPASLAHAAWLAGEPALAARFWGNAGRTASAADCVWMLYALATVPAEAPAVATALPSIKKHFPALGLARWRRGALSVSAYRHSPRLVRAMLGELELLAVRSSQAYFGAGTFIADEMTVRGQSAVLESKGTRNPRRPGYDLPLGRPVPIEAWEETATQRTLRRVPPARCQMTVSVTPSGLDLTYRTLDGASGVPLQIALDLPVGTELSNDGRAWRRLRAGECHFVGARQHVHLRAGRTVVRVGPGASAHAMLPMRDTEPPVGCARLLIPLLTPARHRLALRMLSD